MASMDQAQWGKEESRELLMIGGETEREWNGIKTKGKSFWETVSAKMRDRGYSRTPDQCKSNWNNLLNRYKVFLSLLLWKFDIISVKSCPMW